MSLDLSRAAAIALEHAKKLGMDQSEASLHLGTGVAVTARQQQLETVEKHNDAQLVVSVYKDHKTGSASSADLTEKGIQDTVKAACSIASFTGADECLGLADAELMAGSHIELDLYHPWIDDVSTLADIALECEQAALQYDKRISNSEGASVNSYSGSAVYANSHGFISASSASHHGISCSVIGSSGDAMQRDYWYDSNRNPTKLDSASSIGIESARRTIRRLDSRKIASTQCPVLFENGVAKSLVSHMVNAIKGGSIYKKASFLLDRVGDLILPDFVSIAENPHQLGANGSAWHDAEGVATPSHRPIISEGILQSYVLGSYTSRKLSLPTTANAGGVRNLTVTDTGDSFEQLVAKMNTGLLVTELIGSGVNMLTGDYSRGAAGFWVENGEIQYAVEEITIAGNLLQMYQSIVAIGRDLDTRGNTVCGSILLENMTIAGS
ncbi:MAG: PmbA protein [Dinoroseobacter sp.]|jgi:PmbA protein